MAAAVAVFGALAVDRGDDRGARPEVVDERAGVLNGVRFGDTAAEVPGRARRGEPNDDGEG